MNRNEIINNGSISLQDKVVNHRDFIICDTDKSNFAYSIWMQWVSIDSCVLYITLTKNSKDIDCKQNISTIVDVNNDMTMQELLDKYYNDVQYFVKDIDNIDIEYDVVNIS